MLDPYPKHCLRTNRKGKYDQSSTPFHSLCLCRYVIVPTRRSSAEAIHLMATHALGEAGSPYFIGLLADVSISQIPQT
jgi:hypothetical protein